VNALQPFLTVALPIMATIALATWSQNKRLDDIVSRLSRIESKLDSHDERIIRLEERTNPLTRH
jgi:hypothetical protein